MIGALSAVSSLSYAIQVENPVDTHIPDSVPVTTQEDTTPEQTSEIFADDIEAAQDVVVEAFAEQEMVREPETQVLAVAEKADVVEKVGVPTIPFYSQFDDISALEWKKIGCGVTSLAMIIEYYKPNEITVDGLLNEGINSGAYLNNAGWIHKGLADLADDHGLRGDNYDYSHLSMSAAFEYLKDDLAKGPVIASVYYTFTPGHPIPHLVVINGIEGDTVYYNDPSESAGGGTISVENFKAAWKKRYITVLPEY